MGLLIFTKNKNIKIPPSISKNLQEQQKKMTVTFMCLKNHIKLHLIFYYFQDTFKKSVRNNIVILKYNKEKQNAKQ